MTTTDRERWNSKHQGSETEPRGPSAFLQRILNLDFGPMGQGRALDLATGKGRHALILAEKGFQVDAMDISEVALAGAESRARERGLIIKFHKADLEEAELPEAAYDLIVNIDFLQRSLIPKIKRALKPGGYVAFDTYLIDQRVLGHPKNPAYLLDHNELLDFFRDFRILYYREGKFQRDSREAYRAALFAQKRQYK